MSTDPTTLTVADEIDQRSLATIFQRRPIKRVTFVFDLAVALVVSGLSLILYFQFGLVSRAALVMLGLALVAYRIMPAIAFALMLMASIVQMVANEPWLLTDFVYPILLYRAGHSRQWGERVVGLMVGSLGVAMASTYLVMQSMTLGGVELVTFVATTIGIIFAVTMALLGPWLIGFLLHQRRRLQERAIETKFAAAREAQTRELLAHEHDRTRIARDMHDVVAHSLAVVVAQAEGARYASPDAPDAVLKSLGDISTVARSALSDVRVLLEDLRGLRDASEPMRTGSASAEGFLIERLRSAGLQIELAEFVPLASLEVRPNAVLYRALQEALTNVIKHGDRNSPVTVSGLVIDGDYVMTVANRAAPVPSDIVGSGSGIRGMRERAEELGGWVTASLEDHWFTVTVSVPLSAEHADAARAAETPVTPALEGAASARDRLAIQRLKPRTSEQHE